MGSKVFVSDYETKTIDIENNVKVSQLKLELTVWSTEESLSEQAFFLKEFKEFIQERNSKAGF